MIHYIGDFLGGLGMFFVGMWLFILSLSKDARSSHRWFDKLTISGSGKTLQSSW